MRKIGILVLFIISGVLSAQTSPEELFIEGKAKNTIELSSEKIAAIRTLLLLSKDGVIEKWSMGYMIDKVTTTFSGAGVRLTDKAVNGLKNLKPGTKVIFVINTKANAKGAREFVTVVKVI